MSTEKLILSTHSEAFRRLLSKVSRSNRLVLWPEVKLLTELFGVTDDFLRDRRGAHWASLPTIEKVLVTIRGQGSSEMTLQETALFLNRTLHQLRYALSFGRGRAVFNINDEQIITVARIPKDEKINLPIQGELSL